MQTTEPHPSLDAAFLRLSLEPLQCGDFASARAMLEALAAQTEDPECRRSVIVLVEVARGCVLWDGFHYERALQHLKGRFLGVDAPYRSDWERSGDAGQALYEMLQRFCETLACLEHNELQDIVQDLYWSAERAYRQERFTDCLWRVATIYDTILIQSTEAQLRRSCGIPEEIRLDHDLFGLLTRSGGAPWCAALKQALAPWLRDFKYRFDPALAKLYLQQVRNPDFMRAELGSRDLLRKFQEARETLQNRFHPTRAEEAQEALQLIRGYIEAFFMPSKLDCDSYALGRSAIATLRNLFQAMLQVGKKENSGVYLLQQTN